MNFFQRFAFAFGRTAIDILPDVLPIALGEAVKSALPAARPRLATMLGVRRLAKTTSDGAVIEGASANPQLGAKFTLKNGLPEEQDRRLVIENEPHLVDGFSGEIKEGYGKGTKTLLFHGPAVVKIGGKTSVQTADYHRHDADKAGLHFDLAVTGVPSQQYSPRPRPFEIHFCSGPFGGRRYAVVNGIMLEGKGGRFMVPQIDRTVLVEKPAMILKDRAWLSTLDPKGFIVSRKYDGSLAGVKIDNFRAHMRSHRDSDNRYYDKLPGLEFLQNESPLWTCRRLFPGPRLNGTVLKTEVVHVDGVAKVSGILNSSPDKARQYQQEHGNAETYAWDIVKYKGRDVSSWDADRRRELLEEVVTEIRQYNRNWHVAETSRRNERPETFFDRVVTDKRGLPFSEGVVVASRTEPGRLVKVKVSDAYDLRVVGFVEGTGKYANSLGALRVAGTDGEVGEVGSFAISDAERQFIWDHRAELEGGVAQVNALALTERGVPRAGVFQSFHQDKGSDMALATLSQDALV